MLAANLVAKLALNTLVLEVDIVELNLNAFKLGVLGKYLVKHLGGVVEGYADVAYLAFCFKVERGFVRLAFLKLFKAF